MQAERIPARRSPEGGYIVQVDDLQVGDRMGFAGAGRTLWVPIIDIAEKPSAQPSTVEPGNTASWCGIVERGTFVYPPDAEWFAEPDFERDEDYNPDAIWPEDLA
jgi:hypothetical protein